MSTPRFESPEAYERAVATTGLDANRCVLIASHKLVALAFGINISSEAAVREAFQAKGNKPGSIEIINDPDMFKCAAKVGCQACGQEVSFFGPIDAQSLGTTADVEPLCPILRLVETGSAVPRTLDVTEGTDNDRSIEFVEQPDEDSKSTDRRPASSGLPPPPIVRPAWLDKPLSEFQPYVQGERPRYHFRKK